MGKIKQFVKEHPVATVLSLIGIFFGLLVLLGALFGPKSSASTGGTGGLFGSIGNDISNVGVILHLNDPERTAI